MLIIVDILMQYASILFEEEILNMLKDTQIFAQIKL